MSSSSTKEDSIVVSGERLAWPTVVRCVCCSVGRVPVGRSLPALDRITRIVATQTERGDVPRAKLDCILRRSHAQATLAVSTVQLEQPLRAAAAAAAFSQRTGPSIYPSIPHLSIGHCQPAVDGSVTEQHTGLFQNSGPVLTARRTKELTAGRRAGVRSKRGQCRRSGEMDNIEFYYKVSLLLYRLSSWPLVHVFALRQASLNRSAVQPHRVRAGYPAQHHDADPLGESATGHSFRISLGSSTKFYPQRVGFDIFGFPRISGTLIRYHHQQQGRNICPARSFRSREDPHRMFSLLFFVMLPLLRELRRLLEVRSRLVRFACLLAGVSWHARWLVGRADGGWLSG